jgi:hypothetical protein
MVCPRNTAREEKFHTAFNSESIFIWLWKILFLRHYLPNITENVFLIIFYSDHFSSYFQPLNIYRQSGVTAVLNEPGKMDESYCEESKPTW